MRLPFPVHIAREIPNPFPTADLKVVAVGQDGCEYALKRLLDHPDLPASEWFCYHLGYKIQLALPPFAEMTDGTTQSFGSRFEGGVKQWADYSPTEQYPLLNLCGKEMSRILALDMFVGNDDRHLNNFLFRNQKIAGATIVFAMDFSRGLFVQGWPRDFCPMRSDTNSMMTLALLKSLGIWGQAAAKLTLASIQSVSALEIEAWLLEMPVSWVQRSRIAEVKAWWSSAELNQRLSICDRLV